MAKAGLKLGVSTPFVSEVIATLEHAVGVRLLDRNSKGVAVTPFGEAFLARVRGAFDELRQDFRDIEFISAPGTGELTIGCPESITAGFLLPVLQRLTATYPRVRFHVRQVQQPTIQYPELYAREVDLFLARWGGDPNQEDLDPALKVETLFNDPYCLVASANSKWARRRRIDLADLTDQLLIIPPTDAWGGALVMGAFKQRGLKAPNFAIPTLSISLRTELAATGQFITLLTRSVFRTFAKRYALKVLPVALPVHRSPVGIITLKNRTLGSVAQSFIKTARDVAKSLAGRLSR